MNHQVILPAEWAEQDAILLTWPHNDTDWAPYLSDAEAVFFAIAEAILADQALIISCEDTSQLEHCRERLNPTAERYGHALYLYEVPADDTWARDHGPITVYDGHHTVLLDFEFNAWGDKFASARDNAITQNLVDKGAFPGAQHHPVEFVLEGGSIESDGEGTLLTTATCLLTTTRNTGMSREAIEEKLRTLLGVQRVLWLEHGHLEG
ncbi:MAG: agmatine deiminase family protein, partial [Oleiphilaceae bacterium]|nr:agmatine deiminase family protein [Oleiphilaceae bacterium]